MAGIMNKVYFTCSSHRISVERESNIVDTNIWTFGKTHELFLGVGFIKCHGNGGHGEDGMSTYEMG